MKFEGFPAGRTLLLRNNISLSWCLGGKISSMMDSRPMIKITLSIFFATLL